MHKFCRTLGSSRKKRRFAAWERYLEFFLTLGELVPGELVPGDFVPGELVP
jgi:hypothetical protein